ncbi:hypothetical protein GDO78_012870 [Eleutherodactylus coqui]|uniref:Uncharacterized protein n=1 Tax=Eleutherodactylus coqui TaxID=57060 RepID=A0A8J6F0C2_ELECQ|nr:hypothetical protein GDO78_012870 [Eleutherodactylus coqui]
MFYIFLFCLGTLRDFIMQLLDLLYFNIVPVSTSTLAEFKVGVLKWNIWGFYYALIYHGQPICNPSLHCKNADGVAEAAHCA